MSFSYFNKLNYTLANEDTRMEVAMLPDNVQHIVSVCGSGGRAFPLLAKGAKELSLIDLSPDQLLLAELRLASMRHLDFEQFLSFWGYPGEEVTGPNRKSLFDKFDLSKECRSYFGALFEKKNWSHILYDGTWEATIRKMSAINQKIVGQKAHGLFECKTLQEQKSYLEKEFPMARWNMVVAILGNAGTFNAMLYKGHFPKSNLPTSSFKFFCDVFDRIFSMDIVRKNFFMQLLFFGELRFREGLTAEADPEIYNKMKSGAERCKVNFLHGNIIDLLSTKVRGADFVSLSDVPSYFSGKTELGFMQQAKPALLPNAKVVVRNYQRVPWRTDLTGYLIETGLYKAAIDREATQVYLVDVFKLPQT
jgi:S-adenosylmethionine-diacylglycerol 3-amino-3-carboxypropyl transferase